MERETGIEPATNSLEGCDSTTELLPRGIGGGGRIRTSVGRCPADLQSAAIVHSATPPGLALKELFAPIGLPGHSTWSRHPESNRGPAAYKAAALAI